MKNVQCYELFGGIALKNQAFFSPFSCIFIYYVDFCLTIIVNN